MSDRERGKLKRAEILECLERIDCIHAEIMEKFTARPEYIEFKNRIGRGEKLTQPDDARKYGEYLSAEFAIVLINLQKKESG